MQNVVVVGVDGSEHSQAALEQAVIEARCRSADLHVVYAYEPDRTAHMRAAASALATGPLASPEWGPSVLREAERRDAEERSEDQRHAEEWLRQFVHAQELDLSGLVVEISAVGEEHPAAALARVARDAELLVVGSRGLGGFTGVLLGSISQHCARHAECPVLVVRPRTSREGS